MSFQRRPHPLETRRPPSPKNPFSRPMCKAMGRPPDLPTAYRWRVDGESLLGIAHQFAVSSLLPEVQNQLRSPSIDLEKLSSYSLNMPRRKAGTLLPLEVRILEIAQKAQSDGTLMYGFALASALSEDGGKTLTSHGTLYKALARLADGGLLETEWEDPEKAELEGRPRRRLYRISSMGSGALNAAHTAPAVSARPMPALRPVQP